MPQDLASWDAAAATIYAFPHGPASTFPTVRAWPDLLLFPPGLPPRSPSYPSLILDSRTCNAHALPFYRSLGISSSRPTTARNTVAWGTANDEGAADPANILSGEWAAEHEWALESYEEVKRIACEAAAKRHAKNGH